MTLPAKETYQPRSSAGSSSAGDEKQCRTTGTSLRELTEDRERVVVRRARVDDEGLGELHRQLRLRAERFSLTIARGEVAVVVEPGLADRDRLGV